MEKIIKKDLIDEMEKIRLLNITLMNYFIMDMNGWIKII